MNRVTRGILLSAFILVAGFLFAAKHMPAAHAYEKSTQLKVNFDEMIRLNIEDNFEMRLYADGRPHFQKSALKVYLETNSYYGYDFIMETDSPDLVNTADPSVIIPNMTTQNNLVDPDDSIPMNTWGIGVVRESGNFQDIFYSSGSNIPLKKYTYMGGNSDVAAHDKLALTIGARINDEIPTGSYETTIRFSIVPKIIPNTIQTARYLQELSSTIFSSMTQFVPYQLRDIRDNKPYYIMRIGSNVTMIENLDYDLSEGDALGSMTSNINTSYKNITNVADHPSIDYNQAVYVSGGNVYRDGAGNETINNEPATTAADANNRAGGYYSYAAAIANSVNLYTNEALMNSSLCPKNWRLPTYTEAQTMYNYNNPGNIPWSNNNGYISLDNTLVLNEGQFYWTAEIDSPNKTVKVFSPSELTTNYIDARNLASVRCVYNVSYPYKVNIVLTNEDTRVMTNNSTNTTLTNYYSLNLNNNNITGAPANRRIIGFSENPDASIPTIPIITTLSSNYMTCNNGVEGSDYCSRYVKVTASHSETTIYAIWAPKCNRNATTIDEAVCMQDMNSLVRKSMEFNEQYRLMDERDGQLYWVSRLDDDKVWMTQNLSYMSAEMVHYPDQSNVETSSVFTIDASTEEGYYMKDGVTKKSLAKQPDDPVQKHYNLGKYYTGSQSAVCPGGWQIGDVTQAAIAAGILSTEGRITNNPEIAGGDIIYDSSLTNERFFGAPLYLTAGGYRENGKSYSQGTRAVYIHDGGNSTFSLATEDGNIIVNTDASRRYSEYGQIRCVATAKGLDEIEYMQDITNQAIANTPGEIEFQLTDKRDGKKYWVKKDNKGYLYMIQNLDFRIPSTGVTLYEDTSDGQGYIESAHTLLYSDSDLNVIYQYYLGDIYYAETGSAVGSTVDLAEDAPEWKGHVGSYYTSGAASAGDTYNGTFANSTICPKNWTISSKSIAKNYWYVSGNYIYQYNSSSSRQANPSIARGYARLTADDTFTTYIGTSNQAWSNFTTGFRMSNNYLRPVRCVMNLPFVQRIGE